VDEECSTACSTPQWQGDGFCDDDNNHCGCDWDGGDCCGTGAATQYAYCKNCYCLDPDDDNYAPPSDDATCLGQCYHTSWVGDNYCDDGNNNCGCNWDGGDCCGTANKYQHCTKCACLDPDLPWLQTCTGSCAHSAWTGDGYCDDGNNNCGCDWDQGDCCGEDKKYTQCTECKCQDPSIVSFTTDVPQNKFTGVVATTEHLTDEVDLPPTPPDVGGGGGITPPQNGGISPPANVN